MASDTSPKKDVIYVDIEDDITSIIDKVKGARASIVALVPPKRIGVLQSVVNLKLLQRAANSVDKRIVLITSDSALSGLAAEVAIPIAKNLQTKPEVPEVAALDGDDEDIINGEELPVGELADTAPGIDKKPEVSPVAKSAPVAGASVASASTAVRATAKAPKRGARLPNFDKFRKKLFLIIGGGIALIVFLVWAIVFAPQATVTITAKTNLINIAQMLQLKPNATLDTAQHILPASVQQTKKTTSVDFEATGTKDVGDKATGNVKFSTNQIDKLGTTIPAGTPLTASNGLTYLTDASVTLTLSNYSNAPTTVTAAESGSKYNGANGSVSGAPNGINASLTDVTAGGTDKTVTVVSDADIAKAKEQLQSQDANTIKTELKKQFESGTIVIDESFKADSADPTSTPKVGEQVSGKAKLTAETTYTLVGVKRSDLKANFEGYLKAQLTGKENQKVYTSGDDAVRFSQFIAGDGFYTVKVSAEAQVGPKIDDAALKPQLVGKRAGEIQQQLSVIEGVENVDTNFSPFWVTTAPSADKITIKFLLKNDAN